MNEIAPNLGINEVASVSDEVTVHKRKTTYWLFGIILSVAYLFMLDSSWKSSGQFHTILEVIAMLLAFVVGAIALVEYHSRKDITTLFVGAGFFGTGALDCYHAIVTSAYFREYLPSGIETLIPWSWVASRFFLALMLCMGYYFSIKAKQTPNEVVVSEKLVYVMALILTLSCFAFFAFVPLPRAYYPELPFHRPEEFVPALLFLFALVGFYRKNDWHHNKFEHWLIISLLINLISQAVYMAFSGVLFDIEFDIAHSLKCLSYLTMLIGLIYNIHSSFSDIHLEMNNRIMAEEELRHSQIKKTTIIDTMADGLIVFSNIGIIEEANIAAEKIFNRTSSAIMNMHISVLTPDAFSMSQDKITFSDNIQETDGVNNDGKRFAISISIGVMKLGSSLKYSALIRDISIQKQQERQKESRQIELEKTNAELEKFAYVASHDLQEPLRKVTAFADRLDTKYKDVLDDRGRDYLKRLVSASKRMQTLISDLLSFSRLSSGEIKLEPHDLNKIVEGVISDLEVNIQQKQATIHKPSLPIINCDPPQIRQLFQNLLSNSLKFQREGTPPLISIRVENIGEMYDTNGLMRPWCRIEIEDNGIGFSEEYNNKIFEIFQRLHRREEYEGTGIGLAIVKKVIDHHGGRITVNSIEGEGTTFILTLPLTL